MKMPIGVNVWIPGSDLEACITMALREWAAEHPQDVRDIARSNKAIRDSMKHRSGMTLTKTKIHSLEIPETLGNKIMKMTHNGWMHDKDILKTIRKITPLFNIGQKPEGAL